jgi:hypothetical protein
MVSAWHDPAHALTGSSAAGAASWWPAAPGMTTGFDRGGGRKEILYGT